MISSQRPWPLDHEAGRLSNVMLFLFIGDVSGWCCVFNLLYAAPGDWMGAVLLVQILSVTLIPAVTRAAVHFLTMGCCALTQQHTTCNKDRIKPSGTPTLANVICASILRLCGINPAITKLFSIKNETSCLQAQFHIFWAPLTFLRVKINCFALFCCPNPND